MTDVQGRLQAKKLVRSLRRHVWTRPPSVKLTKPTAVPAAVPRHRFAVCLKGLFITLFIYYLLFIIIIIIIIIPFYLFII